MFRRHGQKPSTAASANSHSSGNIAKVRYAPSRAPSTDSGSVLSRERSHQLDTWWTSCAHLITWIEDHLSVVDAESLVKVPRAVRTAYSQMTASPETRQDVYARHQVPTIRAFLTSYQLDGEPDLGPLEEMLTLAEQVKNKYSYKADSQEDQDAQTEHQQLGYQQSLMEDPVHPHEYAQYQDGAADDEQLEWAENSGGGDQYLVTDDPDDFPDFEQAQHQADELYLGIPIQQLSLDDTSTSDRKRNRRFGRPSWATEFNEEYDVH